MSTVQEIQSVVSHLSAEELARFRAWFEEFDARLWEVQLEKDARNGKLDELARQAIADFHAGKCTEP